MVAQNDRQGRYLDPDRCLVFAGWFSPLRHYERHLINLPECPKEHRKSISMLVAFLIAVDDGEHRTLSEFRSPLPDESTIGCSAVSRQYGEGASEQNKGTISISHVVQRRRTTKERSMRPLALENRHRRPYMCASPDPRPLVTHYVLKWADTLA